MTMRLLCGAFAASLLAGCVEVPGKSAFKHATKADKQDAEAAEVAPADDAGIGDAEADVPDGADDTGPADVAADAAGADAAPDTAADTDVQPDMAKACDPVDCADGNPCTADVCDPATGQCSHPPASAPCDDGKPCTSDDACQDGACTGGAVQTGWCLIGGACYGAQAANPEAPCQLCDAAVSASAWSPQPAGVACKADDLACTTDACDGKGACAATPDDGKCADKDGPCAVGKCDPSTGCIAAPLPKDATCAGADGVACTVEHCDGQGGCDDVPVPTAALCDDGVACTVDACTATGCQHDAQAALCGEDGNPCTDAACDLVKGCASLPNTATCTDGDACTVGDTCADGACAAGKVATCDDGSPCTADACDPVNGCTAVANTAACDDGDACTEGDACAGSKCVAGKSKVCDDGNPCTTDVCDPVKGCLATANTAPCQDGDACTEGDACAGGKCLPGKAKICDDGNACTKDACDGALGCQSTPLPGGVPCSDAIACTQGDACDGKAGCVAGPQVLFGNATSGSAEPHDGRGLLWTDTGFVTVGFHLTGGSAEDGAIVTFDAAGQQLVAADPYQELAGPDQFFDVAPAPGGHVVAVGRRTLDNESDTWLALLDPATGKSASNWTYATADHDHAQRVLALADGFLLLTLSKATGEYDIRLVWVKADGNLLADKVITGSGDQEGYGLAPAKNGDILVSGSAGDPQEGLLQRVTSGGSQVCAKVVPGSPGQDWLVDVAELPDGGIVAVGRWNDGGANTDGWLVRFSPDCQVQWEKKYKAGTADQYDAFRRVAVAADGGLYIGGVTTSAGPAGMNAWLLRTDGQGNVIWQKAVGGSGEDWLWDMEHKPGQGIAFVGSTTSYGNASKSFWLVRTDEYGHVDCATSGGCFAQSCDDGQACTADACDGAKGCEYPAAADGVTCDDGEACTVLDTCAGGECQAGKPALWYKTFGTELDDSGYRVAATADGGAFVAASTDKSNGLVDLWLIRVDGTGNTVWAKTFGGTGAEVPAAIVAEPDGGATVLGWTSSAPAVGYDALLMRAAADGSLVWSRTIGTGLNEFGLGLVRTDTGYAFTATRTTPADGNDVDVYTTDALGLNPKVVVGLGGPGNETSPLQCLRSLGNGELAVVVGTTVGGKAGFRLVRTKSQGGVSVDVTHVYPAPGGNPVALFADGDSGHLVVSQMSTAGGKSAHFARLDGAGKLLSSKQVFFGGTLWLASSQPAGDGGLILTGWAGASSAARQAWLARVTAQLEPSWTAKLPGVSDGETLSQAAALPGGHVLVAGTTKVGTAGGADARLVRLDAFGNQSCGAAGSCAGKAAAACDDKDVCTADSCSGDKGCMHTPLTCDDGNPCTVDACNKLQGCEHQVLTGPCLSGNCKADDHCANGQCSGKTSYFTSPPAGQGLTSTSGVAAATDGGLLVTGWTAGSPTQLRAQRLSPSGALSWQHAPATSGLAYGAGAVQHSNGTWVIAGSQHIGGKWSAVTMFVEDTGKHTATTTYLGIDGVRSTTNGAHVIRLANNESQVYQVATVAAVDFNGDDAPSAASHDVVIFSVPFGNPSAPTKFGVAAGDDLDEPRALVEHPGGGFYVAGYTRSTNYGIVATTTNTKTDVDGFVTRFLGNGPVAWSTRIGGPKLQRLWGVAVAPDGGCVAAGENDGQAWLVRLGQDGKVLQDKQLTGQPYWLDLTASSDGRLVAVGGAQAVAWLAFHASGDVLHQASYSYGSAVGHGIAALAGGAVAIAFPSGPGAPAATMTIDAGGNSACLTGPCQKQTLDGCSDANPCTLDVCTGAGCTHQAMPDATVCGDGKSCSAGTCM